MSGIERSRQGFPDEWRDACAAIAELPHGGVCLVIGTANRDRTAFIVRAAGILSDDGARIAIVDSDIANSELSFPGTVGVAWAAPHFDRLQEMSPVTAYFVGSFSASSAALELTAAVTRAVSWAKSSGAARILVDLPEMAAGASSRRVIAALAQCVLPDLVLGFCEDHELTEVLTIISVLSPGALVKYVFSAETNERRSGAQRSLRRGVRLSRAFGEGKELRLPLNSSGEASVYTLNTPLGTASEVQPHLLRWMSQILRCNVVRAELNRPRQLDIYLREGRATASSGADIDTAIVAEHFGVRAVRQIRLSQIIDTYVGLINQNGKLVGVGRFAGIHGATQEIRITSGVSASHQIRIVQFGQARIDPHGNVYEKV